MSKFKEELMRIQNCETGVECLADSDDPCAECRTEQTINLIASSLPENPYCGQAAKYADDDIAFGKMTGFNDCLDKLKKELEGVMSIKEDIAKAIYDFGYENKYFMGSNKIWNFVDDAEPEKDGARDVANQICNLMASNLPEPKTLSTWDYYHQLKKELEGE